MNRYTKLNAALQPCAEGESLAAVRDDRQGGLIIAALAQADEDFVSWKDALKAVEKLNEQKHLGHADWRLISREEAFALTDASRFSPACDAEALPFIRPTWYWTSTPSAADPRGDAWSVNFYRGYAYLYYQNDDGLVLAVRGGAAAPGQ